METEINVLKKVNLNKPLMIEGLPGVGNVGRIASEYLIKELGAEKFAEIYSPRFMPFALLQKGVADLLKARFYYYKNKNGRDLIFLVGDSQSSDEGYGHYELAEKIMDFAKKQGVKEIITIGGIATGEIEEKEPKVYGAVSHESMVKKYEKYDIDIENVTSKTGMIVGITGLLVGMGKYKNVKILCLMGETTGFPILTDPKSAEKILKTLMKILDLDLDLSKMDKRVKKMEKFLKRLENVQQQALKQLKPKKGKDQQDIRYIG